MFDRENYSFFSNLGEHSETVDGLYEISNKRRLGITEFDAVKEMYDGIKALLDAEKSGA